ncbi:hypothetical protein QCE51_13080 [Staphylococcus aureus]|uniref:hypothetical protein n=2 Tax=Staphylococcus aureus TaxID=1280 RepID=UPI000AC5BFBD|nr:hypothetical protein [Staphylococcus aureus]MDG6650634.1 hypothetical protein [Staphylococcus aureus]MDG6653302.1 hypothetical protein [Staphylococcus aureus]MDG6663818.1 hypothetical protein [Staphylococcus aureus]MDG6669103.1 hypothetical protein [Staphylococcus aureus]MDG6674377.1 hypothetical protein [Staphylococcus aureus]
MAKIKSPLNSRINSLIYLLNLSLGDLSQKRSNMTMLKLYKISFGEITMDPNSQKFILEDENIYKDLVANLHKFIEDLELSKEKMKQDRINKKLLDELNNGGETANLIAEIFSK